MALYSLSLEEQITMSKVKLQRSNPFFAYILMNMRIRPISKDSYIDTMAVNEIGDLFYAPQFVEKLPPEELKGVLAHEAMHMAMLTFQRRGKRDHLLWNCASDIVNNYLLEKEKFALPKDALKPDANGFFIIPAVKGQKEVRIKVDDNSFAEDIYDKLQQHRNQMMQALGV